MILTCPDCATSYFVDDEKIGPDGRAVRCASCGTRWTARLEPELHLTTTAEEGAIGFEPLRASEPAADPVAVSDLPAEELPKVFRARAEARRNVKAAAATGVIWGVIGVVLLLLLGAAYVFRVDVVRIWPRTASAYAMIGLPVNPVGLDFEGVEAKPALQEGHATLLVTGKIRNIKDHAIEMPALKIEVTDAKGKAVATKIADPDNASIPPGQTRHFLVSLLDPPVSSQDVKVSFVLDRKTTAKAAAAAGKTPLPKVQLRGPAEEAPPLAGGSPEPIEAKALPPGAQINLPEPPAAPALAPTPAAAPKSKPHG